MSDTVRRFMPGDPPSEDMDSWYSCCPDCELVGPPSSADYALTGPPPDGVADWDQPVLIRCMTCGHKHAIGTEDLLAHDADHTGSRCQAITPVPAEVVCRTCHLFSAGPAARADQAVADKQRMTLGLHAIEMQETLRQATQQAVDRHRRSNDPE